MQLMLISKAFRGTATVGPHQTLLQTFGVWATSVCVYNCADVRRREIEFPDTQTVHDINRRADQMHAHKLGRVESEAKCVFTF